MDDTILSGDLRLSAHVAVPSRPGPSLGLVLCHGLPNPPRGAATVGTTYPDLADHIANEAGWVVLTFNFRGTGTSAGTHDQGEGEQDDVIAAMNWMKKKHPGLPLIVGGFSFGAWVASRVACEMADVRAVFLIGTPVNKYDFGYLRHCEKPILFLHGTQDEHGDVDKIEKLSQQIRNAETMIITGADHFFT